MKRYIIALVCEVITLMCGAGEYLPYKDATLPTEVRVNDLLGRMTLEEKIAQISHIHSWHIYEGQKLSKEKLREKCGDVSYGFFEGFPLTATSVRSNFHEIQKYLVENTRLGIPAFPCAESLHGVVHEGCTIYPQNIAVGSTFNTSLARKMSKYISGELNTLGIKQVFAPCMDVVRDIRWGRTEESFGEDPWLCTVMSLAEVDGYIEGGTSPMLKHYGPHGKPNGGLNIASVECGTRDLYEIYMKPFETVLAKTPVMAVMSSYNSWNRVPNSASRFLLTDLLRGKYGFRGYVYSDWGTLNMLKNVHRTAETNFDAARQGLTAGLDVEASSSTFTSLAENIRAGRMDESYVDEAVKRVLRAKIETGLMDDPYMEKCTFYMPIHGDEAVTLSRAIADESVVLLKNDNNILPLDKSKLKNVAVIGPNAATVQFGDYTWSKSVNDGVSPLQGIKQLLGDKVNVRYARGCSIASLDTAGIDDAVRAAAESDVAIVVVGSSSTVFVRDSESASTSGEGIDLTEIELTGAQEQLVRRVASTGTPVVMVLVSGKPFAIPWEAENIPAILVQWYG
ncbi:MAG: glycoside hydrolase family 3 C-terminal domain-containing protein, partial [Muribaculaceae bacterium]|nr:glycoside hydrolase family 3 C-terminal domain-containing protein [Muribaculaceae bacterium]